MVDKMREAGRGPEWEGRPRSAPGQRSLQTPLIGLISELDQVRHTSARPFGPRPSIPPETLEPGARSCPLMPGPRIFRRGGKEWGCVAGDPKQSCSPKTLAPDQSQRAP